MPREKTFIFTDEWCSAISQYLKAQKRLHVLTLPDICARLSQFDIDITPANLGARINSGKLSSTLLVAVLVAMGEETIDLSEIIKQYKTFKAENGLVSDPLKPAPSVHKPLAREQKP